MTKQELLETLRVKLFGFLLRAKVEILAPLKDSLSAA